MFVVYRLNSLEVNFTFICNLKQKIWIELNFSLFKMFLFPKKIFKNVQLLFSKLENSEEVGAGVGWRKHKF